MDRKRKLRFIQITLLLFGLLTIFFTYIKKENNFEENMITKKTKKILEKKYSN